jgi:hypothetical protein
MKKGPQATPVEPLQEGGKEEAAISAQAEERKHGNDDHDQTDDIDDGIHGGNSLC